MVIEGLIGSLLGGLFRIAPEVINVFDRKSERAHELLMLNAEMEFARVRGEIHMKVVEAGMAMAELDALAASVKEQGQTSRKAGAFVAGVSALVRPLVTYWFVALYSLMKLATIAMAFEHNEDWKSIFITTWSSEDMAIFSMILTFWFVGRIWDRQRKSKA